MTVKPKDATFNPMPQRQCPCGKWLWLPNYHAHREYRCQLTTPKPTNGA